MRAAGRSSIPRRAQAYFALAFAALLAALLLWQGRARDIDLPTAAERAGRMLTVYVHDSGEPPVHFIAAGAVGYRDGWEFAWRYRPCAAVARAEDRVGKSGSASYTALPDCSPRREYAVRPKYI